MKLLILPLALCSGLLVNQPLNGQVIRPSYRTTDGSISALPALDLARAANASSDSIAASESERALRYDHAGTRPLFDKADPLRSDRTITLQHYQEGVYSLADAVAYADLIAIGRVQSSTPHLSRSGSTVYSTFIFIPTHPALKGVLPASVPLVLSREGGAVLFPSGSKRLLGIQGRGLPIPGYEYLLFLKKETSGFSIVGGFYIVGDHTLALDARADKIADENSPSTLLSRIKQLAADSTGVSR